VPRPASPLVAFLVVLVALGAGGCTRTAPALTDPREILALAAGQLQTASSVHIDASIDGSIVLGAVVPGFPIGGGSNGGALSLTGTHLAGDLDLANAAADLTVEVPALLGLTGEVREVGGIAYLRSSLTGKSWRLLDASTGLPIGAWRPLAWVDGVKAWLARPTVVPTRLDDAGCPAGTCYVVRIVLDGPELGLADPASRAGVAVQVERLTVDLSVDRATGRFSQLVAMADLASAGSVTATITLTGWDASVHVAAPPASEVTSGPLLP
jgi:hypothetical protein